MMLLSEQFFDTPWPEIKTKAKCYGHKENQSAIVSVVTDLPQHVGECLHKSRMPEAINNGFQYCEYDVIPGGNHWEGRDNVAGWFKVVAIPHIFDANPQLDMIIMMDTDIAMCYPGAINHLWTVSREFPTASLILSDNCQLGGCHTKRRINTGVFFARRGAWTSAFIQKTWQHPGSRWGPEQDAMTQTALDNMTDFNLHAEVVPCSVFNNLNHGSHNSCPPGHAFEHRSGGMPRSERNTAKMNSKWTYLQFDQPQWWKFFC